MGKGHSAARVATHRKPGHGRIGRERDMAPGCKGSYSTHPALSEGRECCCRHQRRMWQAVATLAPGPVTAKSASGDDVSKSTPPPPIQSFPISEPIICFSQHGSKLGAIKNKYFQSPWKLEGTEILVFDHPQ